MRNRASLPTAAPRTGSASPLCPLPAHHIPPSTPADLPEGTRAAPPPPDYIATMRMEDMLLAAAEAAAAGSAPVGDTVGGLSGAEAQHFRVALARYQEHPGIQRKQALGERAAKARREVRQGSGGQPDPGSRGGCARGAVPQGRSG
eukprot:scaffold15657_cov80-Isochrysis_galbana.AAC.2